MKQTGFKKVGRGVIVGCYTLALEVAATLPCLHVLLHSVWCTTLKYICFLYIDSQTSALSIGVHTSTAIHDSMSAWQLLW